MIHVPQVPVIQRVPERLEVVEVPALMPDIWDQGMANIRRHIQKTTNPEEEGRMVRLDLLQHEGGLPGRLHKPVSLRPSDTLRGKILHHKYDFSKAIEMVQP